MLKHKEIVRKKWIIGILFFLLAVFLFNSCREDEPVSSQPLIQFSVDAGLVHSDTAITLGSQVKVGITASCESSDITYFSVTMDNGVQQTYLDSGLHSPNLNYQMTIVKSNSPIERWTFTVMNRDRRKASVSIILSKKNSVVYGNIITFPSIILGAQSNTTYGNFLSLSNGLVYTQDSAFKHQDLINIIYYYGAYNATLSSPYENEAPLYYTGTTGLANWTIKNDMKYDTTTLSVAAFDAAVNDSLLLVSFDLLNSKRKAKYLANDMILSFINNATGKIGLIKVISVNGTTDGSVELSIKVQQ